jgi:hypothetical protein
MITQNELDELLESALRASKHGLPIVTKASPNLIIELIQEVKKMREEKK